MRDMKWGVGLVVLIIAGATCYFWQQSHFDARGNPRKETNTQIETKVRAETPKEHEEKVIPAGSVMEDGTI